jgi:hypothetical protein
LIVVATRLRQVQSVADVAIDKGTAAFAPEMSGRLGVMLRWDSVAWGPARCEPLPERLEESTHRSVFGWARRWVADAIGQPFDTSTIGMVLAVSRPVGDYPCCEAEPALRMALKLEGPRADELTNSLLAANSNLVAPFGVRYVMWAGCWFSFDGRKWRRIDLKDSKEEGLTGRTMWGMRCNAHLRHLARALRASRSVGEAAVGDHFPDWDSLTWEMWAISYWPAGQLLTDHNACLRNCSCFALLLVASSPVPPLIGCRLYAPQR